MIPASMKPAGMILLYLFSELYMFEFVISLEGPFKDRYYLSKKYCPLY